MPYRQSPAQHTSRHVLWKRKKPGTRLPPPDQPGKRTPAQIAIEKHHLERELSLGHLRKPTSPGPCGARTHLVPKPGEDPPLYHGGFGRLVVDYRRVNAITVDLAAAMTESRVHAKCLLE